MYHGGVRQQGVGAPRKRSCSSSAFEVDSSRLTPRCWAHLEEPVHGQQEVLHVLVQQRSLHIGSVELRDPQRLVLDGKHISRRPRESGRDV